MSHGFPVVIVNTRPDVDTSVLLPRLDTALSLIRQYQSHVYHRLGRDITCFAVRRYVCRGAYFSQTRTCLVELTYLGNAQYPPAEIAATIIHEATHGRLGRLGFVATGAAAERLCRRAEVRFGQALPDGSAVIERAEGAIAGSDEEVAPTIDWALARRRAAAGDLAAATLPLWLKRLIARRRGLELPEPNSEMK